MCAIPPAQYRYQDEENVCVGLTLWGTPLRIIILGIPFAMLGVHFALGPSWYKHAGAL